MPDYTIIKKLAPELTEVRVDKNGNVLPDKDKAMTPGGIDIDGRRIGMVIQGVALSFPNGQQNLVIPGGVFPEIIAMSAVVDLSSFFKNRAQRPIHS